MVRHNYAKSFDGFSTRILTKITAMTVIQYINKNIFNRNINNLKINDNFNLMSAQHIMDQS